MIFGGAQGQTFTIHCEMLFRNLAIRADNFWSAASKTASLFLQ